MEITRQWHKQSDAVLPAISGDEGLAFATAFYSPDHPVLDEQLVHPKNLRLPPEATFDGGWAALCYDGDASCIALMGKVAARASRYVRSKFALESTLLGQSGATQGFVALIVPPSIEDHVTPLATANNSR
jgi:hypothetical protein